MDGDIAQGWPASALGIIAAARVRWILMSPRTTGLFWPWWVLLAALAMASCASGADAPKDPNQVRVSVAKVGADQGVTYVLLQERGGRRYLPIVIGNEEALAIMFELRGEKPARPLPYQLLRDVIVRTGNHVDRVEIAEVQNEIYFAKIYLDDGRYTIDSRPSDAIALAMGVGAPIFVAVNLMEVSQTPPQSRPIHIAHGFGISVQELTPELARYFGVDARDGVLVAETDSEARQAGIEHGDIITQVEGREVHTPEDFARQAATSATSNVALTLLRRGKVQVITLPATGKPPGH
jgi:uncharacterized protein